MTIWSAQPPASDPFMSDQASNDRRSAARARAAVAARRRGDDLSDAGGRRRDAADRIRPVDHRMEAGDRRAAAAVAGATGRRNSRNTRRSRNTASAIAAWRSTSSRRSTGGNGRTGCWRARPARCSCCRFCFSSGAAGLTAALQTRLWSIFAGGAALGAVGWWMVSSGLPAATRVSVSQYRLAFHLTLACAIYAAVLWTAQQADAAARR